MISYWTAFAHTGTPNASQSPRWPRFTGGGEVLRLAPDAIGLTDYRADHQCGFWSTME